jgi:hypothetical protein
MPKKSMNFRLEENSINELSATLGVGPTEVVETCMEAYNILRHHTLTEMQSKFTRKEIICMVSMQNGTMLTPQYQASIDMYLGQLDDAEALDGLTAMYGADYKQLRNKVAALSAGQVYYWQQEIHRFWNVENAYGAPSPDLNRFIDRFAKEDK